jgi:hypothetical protein
MTVRRLPFGLRLLFGVCLALPLGLTLTSSAEAAWSSSGSGTAASLSYTMPSGGQPTASVSRTSVTLSWPAALFPDDRGVAGYEIARFNAGNGSEATVGASCSGTVTTTTCTELNVPAGTWIYADTPVQDNWVGGQSVASAPVTVS